jgi:hypothetical protein
MDDTGPLWALTMTAQTGGSADISMSQREDLSLAVVCLGVILLSVGGIAAALVTGLLPSLDGLLLVLVCLMMIALFAPPLLAFAKQSGWLPSRRKKPAAAETDGPAKPSGEGK